MLELVREKEEEGRRWRCGPTVGLLNFEHCGLIVAPRDTMKTLSRLPWLKKWHWVVKGRESGAFTAAALVLKCKDDGAFCHGSLLIKNNSWPEGDTAVKGQTVKLLKATATSPADCSQWYLRWFIAQLWNNTSVFRFIMSHFTRKEQFDSLMIYCLMEDDVLLG